MIADVSTSVLSGSSTCVQDDQGIIRWMKLKTLFAHNVAAAAEHACPGNVAGAARAWGVKQRTLAAVIKGERGAGLDTVEEIAKGSGFDVWQLLTPGFDPAQPPKMVPLSPQHQEFLRHLAAMARELPRDTNGAK